MSRLDEARRADQARSPAGDALTDLVIRTFRLNGLFLDVAERMARPAGLTAARWQVLGAVLREPLTVSDAARAMGLTRQSVQRLADALVHDGMAEYVDNPRHRRARLLRPTQAGWDAIDVIRPLQHAFTHQVTERIDADELRQAVALMDRLIAKLEDAPWRPEESTASSSDPRAMQDRAVPVADAQVPGTPHAAAPPSPRRRNTVHLSTATRAQGTFWLLSVRRFAAYLLCLRFTTRFA